jgi:hypothetical protein
MLKLNRLSHSDEHFIENALILRELCSLPSGMGWPLVYDPEDNLAKCLQVLQESIEAVKSALSNEAILMELAESVERAEAHNKDESQRLQESSELNSGETHSQAEDRSRSNSVTSFTTEVYNRKAR